MSKNLTQKLITEHCVDGNMVPGEPIGLRFNQTLCQDATGTLVMLILEAMGLDQAKTEVSAQYVDHNLLQEDNKNPDDHLFLLSATKRFGLHYSPPGAGISHPLHMQYFGRPGAALIGSDSHTCAAGCLGMLAVGAGGTDVALAMAGEPVYLKMPKVWGVELTGRLPEWVSAKDLILEMLRRFDVDGGRDFIIEYYGEGLQHLTAMDRHVIANMGAELGATTTVFPADDEVQKFLNRVGRQQDWRELSADNHCHYDRQTTIKLNELKPLIAKPSSPGNVVPVDEVIGEPIHQAYLGSSANPGFRDFAMAAAMVSGQAIPSHVSLDINPSTKYVLQALADTGDLGRLLGAGARLHQVGCNGCIGMGQAPATDKNSLRTTPRNFPGRSGTAEDKVWLCSPETATASALRGKITDPRSINMDYPAIRQPEKNDGKPEVPLQRIKTHDGKVLDKGPNIRELPELEPLPNSLSLPIFLRLDNNVSTDEILPAGAEVLPFRSNIPKISEFAFANVDKNYLRQCKKYPEGHAIIAGKNYGQGSSREHAALALRYLGLRLVIAESFARIHWQNLINFGVLPCTIIEEEQRQLLQGVESIVINDLHNQLQASTLQLELVVASNNTTVTVEHQLDARQREIIQCGGVIPWLKQA